MSKLRVLVVDDSAFNRRTISDVLESLDDVEVIGKAADGDEALRLAALSAPDLITLDLEMPRMDGFTFLRLLMARRPVPVIVVSGYSNKENVFRALELGAIDFVAKPARTLSSDLSAIQQELKEKVSMIRQLSAATFEASRRAKSKFPATSSATGEVSILPIEGTAATLTKPAENVQRPPRTLVVIAASTGGPTAVLEMLMRMPSHVDAAFLLAQHMPERFTKTFAERLDRLCNLRVREAVDGDVVSAGTAFLCPGGQCLEIEKKGANHVARVVAPRPSDRYVPSGDRLFESAAAAFNDRVISVVLTGMGDDGARGVMSVKNAGGVVLAESEQTAVVHGMPGAAVRTGVVDAVLPLSDLADELASRISQTIRSS